MPCDWQWQGFPELDIESSGNQPTEHELRIAVD
jgi:hypothetical protein